MRTVSNSGLPRSEFENLKVFNRRTGCEMIKNCLSYWPSLIYLKKDSRLRFRWPKPKTAGGSAVMMMVQATPNSRNKGSFRRFVFFFVPP